VADQLDFGGDPPAARSELEEATAHFQLARIRDLLRRGGRPYPSRPCRRCGATSGILLESNGQNTVYCVECGTYGYNAPKTETGQRPRSVKTARPRVKPSQQARIFDRDQGRCILCGTTDDLTIGHLLSIEEAHELGETGPELHDDANLAAMCEACNLGLGRRSVSPRTYAVLMHRLVRAEAGRAQVDGQGAPVRG
jgi:5-methylcytosine-specific restriction endonuclease McrA